jgi:uncharacterized lipoprotein YddW (UPF0748 family)
MRHWYIFLAGIAAALCLAHPAAAQSRRGELRGAWMGSGYDRDWSAIMEQLADNGFNALFPNFSTGTVAYYPSDVLPQKDPVRTDDELAAAVRAARRHGVELHVWRINWALYGASPGQLAELEEAGRLQRDARGGLARDDPDVGVDWLCPSQPENRSLEAEAMLEVVRRYDVDGVQFDYMRFPGEDYCFCDSCKTRFQREAHVAVERWPDGVLGDGRLAAQWREWRRDLLTGVAVEIADQIHSADPECFVSLASWPHLEGGRELLGQDWPEWLRAGALDFVCPMDYTLDEEELAEVLESHVATVRGAVPVYVGLAAFRMTSAWQLIDQVVSARAAGADGFVAFAYGSGDLAEWLPQLGATVAAADPDPTPHGAPPARLSFAGPAAEPPAEGNRVIAGEELEVEITVGWQPPPPEPEAEGAAQAGAMLDRMMDPRSPVDTYGERADLPPDVWDRPRLSGRVLAENPDGLSLRALSAFETDYQFSRPLRLLVPDGPFRIAVYGTAKTPGAERPFVVRGPLLLGAAREELEAEALHSELDMIFADACRHPDLARITDGAATIQMEATGAGGGLWWVRVSNGECEAGRGEVEAPDLTLRASGEDWVAIALNEADPQLLAESGRLTATGDADLFGRLVDIYRGE